MKKLLTDLVRVLSLQLVIVLLVISLCALGYIFRKDILIIYHRWGARSSLNAMRRHAQKSTSDTEYKWYSRMFQDHRKALIRLDYLEERTFNTKYLKFNSPQIETILAEFRKIYPGCSYSCGWRQGLRITCRPETMPTWESLV